MALVDRLRGAGRDCFPSLHTAHVVVVLAVLWMHARRTFFVYLPVGLCVIAATMYLRVHYAVDVIAGAVLAAGAVALAPRLDAWWDRRRSDHPSRTDERQGARAAESAG